MMRPDDCNILILRGGKWLMVEYLSIPDSWLCLLWDASSLDWWADLQTYTGDSRAEVIETALWFNEDANLYGSG